MIDYNSRPIKKMLWTDKIKDIADVRLFYYHLMVDLRLSMMNNSVRELTTDDNKSAFSGRGASDYDQLLKKCFEISGIAKFTLDGIWPELEKWMPNNNDAVKKIPIISDSSGKILYETAFKSGFPAMSILYSLDNFNGNKQYKKVGYGTVKYMAHPHEAEHFYKIYDNESKEYFDGILYKLSDGSFQICIDDN